MNQKFSFKLAALVATFSGTAFCPGGLMPAAWSQTAGSLPPIVSTQQAASTQARSNMLAPISPRNGTAVSQDAHSAAAMPWKVDRSKYQSAIAPHLPPIIPSNTAASTYNAPAANAVPQQATYRPAAQASFQATTHVDSQVQPASAAFAAAPKAQVSAGFSSGGVPIYRSGNDGAAAVPAPPMIPTRPVARVARASQGSGSRNAIGSGIQGSAPMFAPSMPPATFSGELMTADPVMPSAPFISSNSEMIMGSGQSVMSAPMQTAPAMFDGSSSIVGGQIIDGGSPIDSGFAAAGGCNTCNSGGAVGCESGGNCSCGPGGCYNAADITRKAGLYGSVGEARYYSHIEAMVMDRLDDDLIFTNTLQLNGFDADVGYRITAGERFDAINGREFSYWGTGGISNQASFTGTPFPLNQVFQTTEATRNAIEPFGFFTRAIAPVAAIPGRLPNVLIGDPGQIFVPGTPGVASVLIRPTAQSHIKETYFHSVEFNRVRWGWDVFKSVVGIRYIHMNDEYTLNSRIDAGATTSAGTYQNVARNNLIGPHIGAEWFYDVGYRLSVSLNLKGGIYANINKVDTLLVSNGDTFTNSEDSSATFATSLELGLHAHYQIAPRGRLRAGFNILHLEDVAMVNSNFPGAAQDVDGTIVRSIGPTTGDSANDGDNATFTGFSIGLELFR